MSNPSWPSEEQQQWTQPPFTPAPAPATPSDPYRPTADPYQSPPQPGAASWNPPEAVSGAVIVPGQAPYAPVRVRVPASPLEAILRTVSGVLFPAMIALAIFGVVGWFPAIFIALVVPGLLNQLAANLKRQRIEQARYLAAQPPKDDLR